MALFNSKTNARNARKQAYANHPDAQSSHEGGTPNCTGTIMSDRIDRPEEEDGGQLQVMLKAFRQLSGELSVQISAQISRLTDRLDDRLDEEHEKSRARLDGIVAQLDELREASRAQRDEGRAQRDEIRAQLDELHDENRALGFRIHGVERSLEVVEATVRQSETTPFSSAADAGMRTRQTPAFRLENRGVRGMGLVINDD